mmetsp:Transcript_16095/g.36208  ORF Transcript_16095/g.36208 Transcript_16095/m.36208 type:complete len:116 (+) Transcript_16095:180-527(+)
MVPSSGMAPPDEEREEISTLVPRARPAASAHGESVERVRSVCESLSGRPARILPLTGRRRRQCPSYGDDVGSERELAFGSEKEASGGDIFAQERKVSKVGRMRPVQRGRMGVRYS